MHADAMPLVFKTKLNPLERLCLLAILSLTHEASSSYVEPISVLMRATGIPRRTVQLELANLERLGIIQASLRQRGYPTAYRVVVSRIRDLAKA